MNKIKAGDPITQSEDILRENIETLKSLFPTIVKEGKIDIEELKALLGEDVETGDEYYRFTWAGKAMARREANKPTTATLRPNKADSKDWDTTQNIFIEGDNLEVLKLLQKSYADKIKMIYIDPPYNTGKDFVYKDNYADNLGNYLALTGQTDKAGKKLSTNTESDGRYHSNWLNMMYPRLKLARTLLIDDGVIFISIDDNEVQNLRKLCDEIFGEENFIACISVVSNPRGRDYGGVARMHESLMVYTKTPFAEINDLNEPDKIFPYNDAISGFELRELRNRNIAFHIGNRPNLHYPFYINPKKQDNNGLFEISLQPKEGWVELYPKESQGFKTVWRWGAPKSLENININIAGKEMEDGGYQIVEKYRKKTKMARSVWWDKEDNTEKGTLLIKSLFNNKKVFDFPKPVEMLCKLIEMGTSKDGEIILDFFSGSGSLPHSVFLQNSIDGIKRSFIAVQLQELTYEPVVEVSIDENGQKIENLAIDSEDNYPKIKKDSTARKAGFYYISEVTKERIRRAGEKIKAETKKDLFNGTVDKLDIGFKAFKLDSSNIRAWDGNPENLEDTLFNSAINIKEGRTEEDVLFEILLKNGLDLTLPIEENAIAGKKVFNIGAGALFICLADNITTAVAEGIGMWVETLTPSTCKVIFKDNGFTDVEKTNSIQVLKRFGITDVNSI